ncbi:hypothetical protein [Desulfofustis limnaeus]|uniref:Uncharacterized protein n=1 Tax=Desulfofustis limnaeus TaxID=2740163 RepID=A0ABN6MC87_9BACT|nr:hypothetical protein [Desulfofustis limnaeus]BDD89188.1 hypothetical protein DPPLL_35530 [Desulfofustis limnaeus]
MAKRKTIKKSIHSKIVARQKCLQYILEDNWTELDRYLDKNSWIFKMSFGRMYGSENDRGIMELLMLHGGDQQLISKYSEKEHHDPSLGIYYYAGEKMDQQLLSLMKRYFNNQLYSYISNFNVGLKENLLLGYITAEKARIIEDKFNLYKMLIDILSKENKSDEFYNLARNVLLLSSLKTGLVNSYKDIQTIINNPVQKRKNNSSII